MQDSIYSKNIQAGGRTYFFDIRQTKGGEKYLHITESRPQGTGNLRNNIVIFKDHFNDFYNVLNEIKEKL